MTKKNLLNHALKTFDREFTAAHRPAGANYSRLGPMLNDRDLAQVRELAVGLPSEAEILKRAKPSTTAP